jgi:DNA helicase IV
VRLPTYDELSSVEEQFEVLEHPLDESLFVVGPPGSGKTVLAVQRADMASEWTEDEPVLIVTYNRMLRRLLYLLNEGAVDTRTMHSFVWADYLRRTGMPVPTEPNDSYAYMWTEMLARLRHARVVPDSSHLVVDEGQDLPKGFFAYVSHYVARALTVFADDDQALSQQRTTLEQIKRAANLDDPIILKRNHRNTPEVAAVAEHFHSGRLPAAEVTRRANGELPRLIRSRDTDYTADLVSRWRQTRGGTIGVVVHRNQPTGTELHRKLKARLPGSRVDIYRNDEQNEDSTNIMQDGVTVLNKKSVKGQEFDAFFILELQCFIPFTNEAERRTMYMMCSRARNNLFLVYGPGNLSERAMQALPGPEILERQ